jgi:hypothetical protein
MSDIHGQIKTRLRNIVGTGSGTSAVFPAKVTAVSGNTCEVLVDDNTTLTDVRLLAVINSETSNMLITPKVGSYVLVTDLSGGKLNDLAVLQFSEIEKITINGGTLGGLTNTPKLVEELDKTNDLLEAIINVINSTVPITEPGNGAASALQAALKTAIASKQLGDFSEIEDTKITH